jgi:hypothetical protein
MGVKVCFSLVAKNMDSGSSRTVCKEARKILDLKAEDDGRRKNYIMRIA